MTMICYLSLQTNKMCGSRGETGGPDPAPLKTHKNIGFSSNIGPDLIKISTAIKPAFNVGPSWTRQRNAILMAIRWRADDGPF